MGTDMVDDLHAAEDMIGVLRHRLGLVLAFAARWPWTGLADASGDFEGLLELVNGALTDTYCRPSCEGGADCEDWQRDGISGCACPCHGGEDPEPPRPNDPDGRDRSD